MTSLTEGDKDRTAGVVHRALDRGSEPLTYLSSGGCPEERVIEDAFPDLGPQEIEDGTLDGGTS